MRLCVLIVFSVCSASSCVALSPMKLSHAGDVKFCVNDRFVTVVLVGDPGLTYSLPLSYSHAGV